MTDRSRENCYAFALRLQPRQMPDGTWVAPMGLDVWDWITTEILQEDVNGDIIMYYRGTSDEPTHMGVMEEHLVRSKWGEGAVRLHKINETPYGDRTKRYRVVDRERLLQAWGRASDETIENLQAN